MDLMSLHVKAEFAVWDDKNLVDAWDGERWVKGMILNSKYVDEDGHHPDGCIELESFGTEACKVQLRVASSDVHSQSEIAQIAKASSREVHSRAIADAQSGAVQFKRRAQTQSGGTLFAAAVKPRKGMLFLDSPERTPRAKAKKTTADVADVEAPLPASQSQGADENGEPADVADDDDGAAEHHVEMKGMNRDTANAFDCREKCREFLKGLTSSEAIRDVKMSMYGKLMTRIDGRLERKAVKRYPKVAVDKLVHKIFLNTGDVPDDHTWDESSAQSILTHCEAYKLENHLRSFQVLFLNIANLLYALNKNATCDELAAALAAVHKQDPVVWKVPDDINELLMDKVLDEAYRAIDFSDFDAHSSTFLMCLKSDCESIPEFGTAGVDLGIIVENSSRSMIQQTWINKLLCALAPKSSTDLSADAVSIYHRVLTEFSSDRVHVLDQDYLDCLSALRIVTTIRRTSVAQVLPNAVKHLQSPECKAKMPFAASGFVINLAASASNFIASQVNDAGFEAQLAIITSALTNVEALSSVPDAQVVGHISSIIGSLSEAKTIRATSSEYFMWEFVESFNRIDSFRMSVTEAIFKRSRDSFYAGLEASLEAHPRLKFKAEFGQTTGEFSLRSADDLLLVQLWKSGAATDDDSVVKMQSEFDGEVASRKYVLATLEQASPRAECMT